MPAARSRAFALFVRSRALVAGNASAAVLACSAISTVTSVAGRAFAVNTVTTFDRTCTKPASTNHRVETPPVFKRSSPAPSRPTSGARPCNTPSSPSYIGMMTISATASRTARSGVTMMHRTCPFMASCISLAMLGIVRLMASWKVGSGCLVSDMRDRLGRTAGVNRRVMDRESTGSHRPFARLPSAGLLHGLFVGCGGFFDWPDVHEHAFGQVVPLAVTQFLEAADGVLELREVPALAGEGFRHEERLRQEPLDASRTRHNFLVLFA